MNDTPHAFIPSKRDPEICTFCGGTKAKRFKETRFVNGKGMVYQGELVHAPRRK